MIAELGERTLLTLAGFGDFCMFCARSLAWAPAGLVSRRDRRRLMMQLYEVGTLSVPVVVVIGAFVGMVLTVQTVQQFEAIGLVDKLGLMVDMSVLRELGPVLAGVMLAGRVGGGLTAELGTMRVTEQIDALRAMGSDPIRVLVVPRLLACLLLIPLLAAYASFMGILGGYLAAVYIYGISAPGYWHDARQAIGYFDIFYGPIKSVFFGAAIAFVSCYKGFRCQPGAAGVGRACTESFVMNCMVILGMDLLLGMLLNTIHLVLYGVQVLI